MTTFILLRTAKQTQKFVICIIMHSTFTYMLYTSNFCQFFIIIHPFSDACVDWVDLQHSLSTFVTVSSHFLNWVLMSRDEFLPLLSMISLVSLSHRTSPFDYLAYFLSNSNPSYVLYVHTMAFFAHCNIWYLLNPELCVAKMITLTY